ncbi:MAG: 30S ribosome-binding factor RbfA [Candidatus Omnitrophota bacterium]|jgi:ribosome-binding factor A
MSLRIEKVNSEIQKQLMDIIQKEIDDPCVGFLSITRVDTTSDLKESKIYFSLLDETKYDRVKDILEAMNAFVRVLLGKRIKLKILPELKFIPDTSIKYSVDMYKKIEEVRRDDQERESK